MESFVNEIRKCTIPPDSKIPRSRIVLHEDYRMGVETDHVYKFVVDYMGHLDIYSTVQLKIVQTAEEWRTYTVKQEMNYMIEVALNVLLFNATFSSAHTPRVFTVPGSCINKDRAIAEYHYSSVTYHDKTCEAIHRAEMLLDGIHGERIKTAYGNSVIVCAINRKYHGRGTDHNLTPRDSDIATRFYDLPSYLIRNDEVYVMCKLSMGMFCSLTVDMLTTYAVLLSRECKLGRTIGIGDYPAASDDHTEATMLHLSKEHDKVNAMSFDLVDAAIELLESEGVSGLSEFKLLIGKMRSDPDNFRFKESIELRLWWTSVLDAANGVLENGKVNSKIRSLKDVVTWWSKNVAINHYNMMTVAESKSALTSTAHSTYIIEGNAGMGDVAFKSTCLNANYHGNLLEVVLTFPLE